MRTASVLAAVGIAACAGAAAAQSLTPLSTFGNNGWRAPHVIQSGDSASSNNGTRYNYLGDGSVAGTNNLERSFAYNPATGHLILVSRSAAGNGIRILDGQNANDLGAVAQGTGIITGGTFTTNCVAVGPNGNIYVSNLAVGTTTTQAYKIYSWAGEGSAGPSVFLNTLAPGGSPGNNPRLGDSLAISTDGSTLAAGFQTNGSSVGSGYLTVATSNAAATLHLGNSFTPAVNNSFRLGLTFGATANDVLGKQTSDNLRITEYATNTSMSVSLTGAGESPIAFATIAGVPYLASIDANSSLVRVYDMSNPLLPTVVASGNNTFGLLSASGQPNANLNATGSVQWGAIDNVNQTATLYAMSSNQGIQAFTFTVPSPISGGLFGVAGLFALRRRR